MKKSLVYTTLLSVAMLMFVAGCSTNESPLQPESESQVGMRGANGELAAKPKPTLTTTASSIITSANATSGGNVTSSGTITARGVCYSTSTNPTTANATVSGGSGTGAYSCVLYGLAANTTYYLRAYATNSGGTGYGAQISFTTKQSYGTVTDASGNTYNTITIGNQVWTVENLRTTKYADGTDIDNVTADNDWKNLTTGAYCDYGNNSDNVATYGRLYNWYAVDDAHGLAPSGWHVPTKAEWDTLSTYLGGLNAGGGHAKEIGTSHWATPNTGATNASGFTAVPSGGRYWNINPTNGDTLALFTGMTYYCPFWSATQSASVSENALFVELDYTSTRFYRSGFLGGVGYYRKATGYAVRLVRD